MKLFSVFLTILCVLSFTAVQAQVFIDFDVEALGTDGFADNGWANGLTSVTRIADPTGAGGVLAIGCDASGGFSGVIEKGYNIDTNGAAAIVYNVYLPVNFPDSGSVVLWGQDNATWAGFPSSRYYGIDLPKETWVPLSFDIATLDVTDPDGFSPYAPNAIGKMGVQFEFGASDANYDNTFVGQVLLDDITRVGVEPKTLSDFEVAALGTDGWDDNGWGGGFSGVARVANPAGSGSCVAFTCNAAADSRGVFEKGNVSVNNADMLMFHIYLPANFPADGSLEVFAQDNVNWNHSAITIQAADLPTETWIPIIFNMRAMDLMTDFAGGAFDPYTAGTLGRTGIGVNFGSSTAFTGDVYLDNVQYLDTQTGKRWVIADFELAATGVQDFSKSHGDAFVSLNRAVDVPAAGNAVLEMVVDGSQGDKKAAPANSNLPALVDSDTVTAISIDLYLPAGFPADAYIQIFVQDKAAWGWYADGFNSGDLTIGGWNTLTYNVKTNMIDTGVNISSGLKSGVEILFNTTWSGSVYLDNLTLWGVSKPPGVLSSPADVAVAHNDITTPYGTTIRQNRITWSDLEDNLNETYNLYVCDTGPITDPTAPGVIEISKGLPRDAGFFNHRLYSANGAQKTYYYAMTSTGLDQETSAIVETPIVDGSSNTGAISGSTTVPNVIPLRNEFDFEIDGDISEFSDLTDLYSNNEFKTETGFEIQYPGWTPGSTDLDFIAYAVMDQNNLYMAFQVTDDDPTGDGQAWEGDAVEIYMGLYDISLLTLPHPKTTIADATYGDYRLGYGINAADVFVSNNSAWDMPGLEQGLDLYDDGYVIELKMPLASFTDGPAFTPVSGMQIPFKIWANDFDQGQPAEGDNRSIVLAYGGTDDDNPEAWLRPETWGRALITSTPVNAVSPVDEQVNSFSLKQNYPNPFNPTTTIEYSLKNASEISIVVYDVMGQKVRTLINEKQAAGSHMTVWDGNNDAGIRVASGVYFCKMVTPEFTKIQKMMMLK